MNVSPCVRSKVRELALWTSDGVVYSSDRGKLKQVTLDGVNEKVIIDTGKLSHTSFIITCNNSAVKSKPLINITLNINIITTVNVIEWFATSANLQ